MNKPIVILVIVIAMMVSGAMLAGRSVPVKPDLTPHAKRSLKQRELETGTVYKELEPNSNIYGFVPTSATLAAN